MKEHGQVRYGTLTAEERSMRNYEWGAGIQFGVLGLRLISLVLKWLH